jgi:hypothetical protein
MANLLSAIFPNDDAAAALGLLGASMAAGNMPQGLLAANTYLSEAPDRRMKTDLMKAQIANFNSEVEQRAAAIKKQQDLMAMGQRLIGGQSQPQPGQLGSGSFGIVQPPAGQPDIAPRRGGIENADFNSIVGYHLAGGPDLTKAYEFARTGIERKPGTFYEDLQGRRSYTPDLKSGLTMDASGNAAVIPNFGQAQLEASLPGELAKTFATSIGTVNLRKGDNGREFPFASIEENQPLQSVLARYGLGGKLGAPTAAPATPAAPAFAPPVTRAPARPVAAQPGVTGNYDLSDPALIAAVNDIKDPQERANAMAALKAQQGASGGAPTPAQGYGMSTGQQNAAAADKAYAEGAAKDMVETRKNILTAGQTAPVNIAKYQQLGSLLADVDGGKLTQTGTNIASAANSIGLKIDKNLPNKEAAAALGNEMALQLRSPAGGAGMPGALSDKDREFLTGMVPNANQTSQGRKIMIDSYISLQKRNQQVAQFATNYEKKYGRLDSGFFDQLSAWANANPLFGAK